MTTPEQNFKKELEALCKKYFFQQVGYNSYGELLDQVLTENPDIEIDELNDLRLDKASEAMDFIYSELNDFHGI